MFRVAYLARREVNEVEMGMANGQLLNNRKGSPLGNFKYFVTYATPLMILELFIQM